jgi:arabinofuranosyltransferase
MSLVSALYRRTGSDAAGDAVAAESGTLFARRWNAAMVALPAAVILVLGYRRRWISDDGLIFTRTVRQILAGHGPVYNVGERAEASTSTVWQWLLVLTGWITGADIGKLAVYLGLLCTAAGYALALDGTRRLYRPYAPGRLFVPAGVLLLLALPPVWDFATSGLETGLTTLWTAGCWWLLVRVLDDRRKRLTYPLAVLAGLGPMVRPDLAIAGAGFLVVLAIALRPRPLSALGHLGAAAAVPVAYEIFRAGYYGVLLPLPAITKEASSADWARGRGYLGDFVEPYRLWLPLLLLAALVVTVLVQRARGAGGAAAALADRADRARLVVAVAPVLCGALLVTYVVRVGGDFMHARMLLPGLFFMLLPVLLVPAGRLAAALVAAATLWAVVCATLWRVPYTGLGERGIADERGFYLSELGVGNPITASAYLRHYPRFPEAVRLSRDGHDRVLVYPWHDGFFVTPLKPETTASEATVWPNLGMNGAAVRLDDGIAVDVLGLAYPLAAHVELTERGRPGHEKELDIAWVFADLADPGAALPAGLDPLRVAAARYALTCGDENRGILKELQDSVREPMSWKRFWKNLTGAPKRTTFRFPNDPVRAMKEICGVDEVPEEFLHRNPWLDPARHTGGAS